MGSYKLITFLELPSNNLFLTMGLTTTCLCHGLLLLTVLGGVIHWVGRVSKRKDWYTLYYYLLYLCILRLQ